MKSPENKIIVMGAEPSLISEFSDFFLVSGGPRRLTVRRLRSHQAETTPAQFMRRQTFAVSETKGTFVLEPKVWGNSFGCDDGSPLWNSDTRVITRSQQFASDLKAVITSLPYSPVIRISGESGVGKSHIARLLHRQKPGDIFAPRIIQGMCMSKTRLAHEGLMTRIQNTSDRWSAAELLEMTLGSNLTHLIVDEPQLLPRWLLKAMFDVASEQGSLTVTFCVTPSNDCVQEVDALFENLTSYCPRVFVPPLRTRSADITALFLDLCLEMQQAMRRRTVCVDGSWLEELKLHSWPGNIRELKELARRFVLFAPENGFWRHECQTV